jgi:hypothetical protein
LTKFAEPLTSLGLIEDFKEVTESIADPKRELNRDILTNETAKNFRLEFKNENDKARYAMIQN